MPDPDEELSRAPRGHEVYALKPADEPNPPEPADGVEPLPVED